jgi:hypothetical protein
MSNETTKAETPRYKPCPQCAGVLELKQLYNPDNFEERKGKFVWLCDTGPHFYHRE